VLLAQARPRDDNPHTNTSYFVVIIPYHASQTAWKLTDAELYSQMVTFASEDLFIDIVSFDGSEVISRLTSQPQGSFASETQLTPAQMLL